MKRLAAVILAASLMGERSALLALGLSHVPPRSYLPDQSILVREAFAHRSRSFPDGPASLGGSLAVTQFRSIAPGKIFGIATAAGMAWLFWNSATEASLVVRGPAAISLWVLFAMGMVPSGHEPDFVGLPAFGNRNKGLTRDQAGRFAKFLESGATPPRVIDDDERKRIGAKMEDLMTDRNNRVSVFLRDHLGKYWIRIYELVDLLKSDHPAVTIRGEKYVVEIRMYTDKTGLRFEGEALWSFPHRIRNPEKDGAHKIILYVPEVFDFENEPSHLNHLIAAGLAEWIFPQDRTPRATPYEQGRTLARLLAAVAAGTKMGVPDSKDEVALPPSVDQELHLMHDRAKVLATAGIIQELIRVAETDFSGDDELATRSYIRNFFTTLMKLAKSILTESTPGNYDPGTALAVPNSAYNPHPFGGGVAYQDPSTETDPLMHMIQIMTDQGHTNIPILGDRKEKAEIFTSEDAIELAKQKLVHITHKPDHSIEFSWGTLLRRIPVGGGSKRYTYPVARAFPLDRKYQIVAGDEKFDLSLVPNRNNQSDMRLWIKPTRKPYRMVPLFPNAIFKAGRDFGDYRSPDLDGHDFQLSFAVKSGGAYEMSIKSEKNRGIHIEFEMSPPAQDSNPAGFWRPSMGSYVWWLLPTLGYSLQFLGHGSDFSQPGGDGVSAATLMAPGGAFVQFLVAQIVFWLSHPKNDATLWKGSRHSDPEMPIHKSAIFWDPTIDIFEASNPKLWFLLGREWRQYLLHFVGGLHTLKDIVNDVAPPHRRQLAASLIAMELSHRFGANSITAIGLYEYLMSANEDPRAHLKSFMIVSRIDGLKPITDEKVALALLRRARYELDHLVRLMESMPYSAASSLFPIPHWYAPHPALRVAA